jgi:hypothetical protein
MGTGMFQDLYDVVPVEPPPTEEVKQEIPKPNEPVKTKEKKRKRVKKEQQKLTTIKFTVDKKVKVEKSDESN